MISQKLFDIREKAKEELKHIYKGDIYQNMLRHHYFNLRMHNLGGKSKYPDDKNKILKLSIDMIKKWAKEQGVDFKPQYDKFFLEY